jgi:hypothetical protein
MTILKNYPSYPVWLGEGIYKIIKQGFGAIYKDIKDFIIGLCAMIRGIVIALYIVNKALLGYEDKRIKQHGFTLEGMKQAGIFFWLFATSVMLVCFASFYGIIFYLVIWMFAGSYIIYSDNKEEFYEKHVLETVENNG